MKSPMKFLVGQGWNKIRAACALQTCHNKMLMRSVPRSRAGIKVGDLWYCSVDCFAAAVRTRLTGSSRGRIVEMPHNPRMTIGLVMLSKGYVTDDQLRFATEESHLHGEDLEAALIRLGLATERQLAAARAAQWGYPVFGQDSIGLPVEADIPPTLLKLCSAVPLHHSPPAKRSVLGFVYRVDHTLLHSVEQITGCRAEPCFITSNDFKEQLEHLSALPDYEEVVFEDRKLPAQMARTLGSFAVEISAREARFAQCRDYVWVRLAGKRQTIDVLFRTKGATEEARQRDAELPDENFSHLG